MGNDIDSIMSNPIGQPMATVRRTHQKLRIERAERVYWKDILQQLRTAGNTGRLVHCRVHAVSTAVLNLPAGSSRSPSKVPDGRRHGKSPIDPPALSWLTRSQAAACSRQIFAFSRDGGLPLSRYLYRIHPLTHTPVYCVWFSCLVSLLLGLLAFAGPAAIGAIFSLVVTGQYVAYSIPIACRFFGGQEWVPGPFSLGRLVSRTPSLNPTCTPLTTKGQRASPSRSSRSSGWPSPSRSSCSRRRPQSRART